MRQLNHPNLLPLYCSFVHKQHLWMVMPYVQGGSVLNIMRFAYPEVRGGRALWARVCLVGGECVCVAKVQSGEALCKVQGMCRACLR